LGDNDTKSDAKKIAFIEAKRLCLEKAGTYIESNTEVLNYRLSSDEIRTYAGGILKVEIISEEFKAIGENLTLFTTVKAEVDLNEVKKSLKRIKQDNTFAEKIRKQEEQLQQLEARIRNLQSQLSSNDFDKTAKIRRERQGVFNEIDELSKIKYEIHSKSTMAVENIELGMTPSEVIKLIGEPRSIDRHNFNYGNVWVIFEGGVVGCLVKVEDYRGSSYWSGYPCKKGYSGVKIK